MNEYFLLEIVGDGVFEAERIIGGGHASADSLVALGPLIAILLGDERITKVEEHPRDTHDTVKAQNRLRYQQRNTNTLKVDHN